MQIAVAVLVAILGIVNTLTVSITDRRRELGVLQAVGGLRSQIRRTIWIEALSIALIGLVLGFALGAVQLYLHSADRPARHRRHAASNMSFRSALRSRSCADDSGRGVPRGDLAGRVGRARLAGGGVGV